MLIWGKLPLQYSDGALTLGIVLTAAGLLCRLVAPDSRAKRGGSLILDMLLCGVIGAGLTSAWWNQPPPPNAPLRHNDGGDVVGLVLLPILWILVSGLLLLFRQGMTGAGPATMDETVTGGVRT